jgi:hypothetical protein
MKWRKFASCVKGKRRKTDVAKTRGGCINICTKGWFHFILCVICCSRVGNCEDYCLLEVNFLACLKVAQGR